MSYSRGKLLVKLALEAEKEGPKSQDNIVSDEGGNLLNQDVILSANSVDLGNIISEEGGDLLNQDFISSANPVDLDSSPPTPDDVLSFLNNGYDFDVDPEFLLDETVSDDSSEYENTPKSSREKRIGRKKRNPDEPDTRKRLKNEKQWEKNVRKEKKARGEEYFSLKGELKPEKLLGNPWACRRKCSEKISQVERQGLHEEFYKLTPDGQDQMISNSIEEVLKSRERTRQNEAESRRKFSRKYYLDVGSGKIEVCQTMFLNTFSLTRKNVRVVVEKKRKTPGKVCPSDSRGRHKNHPKLANDKKEKARLHIMSFPRYRSHYSRERTSKKYLNPDLNISKMYRLYQEECESKKEIPIRESYYRKIFTEEFNFSFHPPKNDTCAKCDGYLMAIKNEPNEGKQLQLKEEQERHLRLAERVYQIKNESKERSKKDPKLVTASFDLEKCLPTPYLRNGISFYKRQLWTYNLTVYHTSTAGSEASCYLWNETVAGRGSQEIASCLKKFIHSLPPTVECINFFSDSCYGQNKNIYMAIMMLQDDINLKSINHYFMEPGHTHT